MSCCEPPSSLSYLRDLLARRHDIAVHPPDALDHESPPFDLYLYRPAEVLVPVPQIPRFEAAAERLGIRFWLIGDTRDDGRDVRRKFGEDQQGRESHQSDANGDLDAGDVDDGEVDDGDVDHGDAGGADADPRRAVARFAIGAASDLDTLLERLVRAARGPLHVTPNHVVLTCPRWGLSPHGDPETALDLPGERPEGAAAVRVAVIDSGLPKGYEANHLLAEGVVAAPEGEEPWAYQGTDPVLTFPQGHGTFVAGILRRWAPQAEILSYLVADQDGVTDEWFLGRQVDVALLDRPAVINLSLGSPSRHDESLIGLGRLAAAASAHRGPVVVAAAGNSETARPFWPAAEDWAIGVAAVELSERQPTRAWFSNYGYWVDACALGVDVVSSYEARPYRPSRDPSVLRLFDGVATWSGTSFAAPRVSAAVAELVARHGAMPKQEILDELLERSGAVDFRGPAPTQELGVYVP